MQKNIIRKSIGEVDILRGILCIFVLIIHTTANPSIELTPMSISSILFSIVNVSTKLVVPGFIFISGLTLAYSYKDRELGNIYNFYKKRFISVGIPYVVWSLIYYIVYIVLYNYEISFKFFLHKLINGSMSYHLYFLIIIIQFYILFPIFLIILKKYNNKLILFISIITNFIVIYKGSSYIFFGTYVSYFILGMCFAFNYEQIIQLLSHKRNKIIITFIGVAITIYYIVESYMSIHFSIVLNKTGTTYYVFCLLTILMYYILSLDIYKSENNIYVRFKSVIKKISKVSFNIYLIHPLIIIVLERILRGLSMSVKYGIMTLALIGISFVYANLSYKNKLKTEKC